MGFFKNILFWIYLRLHSAMLYISIALSNTENELLKVDHIIPERDKKTTRMLHRNQTLEKFYAGKRDEKYYKEFNEILKKSDKFMKNVTPYKMAVAADKYHLNYGLKDEHGRRYEHYGFFDDKHKNAGKTLGEVLISEFEERKTKDDDFEILYIFNNKPIEVGLVDVMNVVEETKKKDVDFQYEVLDIFRKSKQFEFPIKVYRKDEKIVNKIEQLTEYLHVKKIGFEYRQLEFFIPLKFGTESIDENSEIYNELIKFDSVFIKNNYGELMGFAINKLLKRVGHNDTHEVWKFEGIEMQTV